VFTPGSIFVSGSLIRLAFRYDSVDSGAAPLGRVRNVRHVIDRQPRCNDWAGQLRCPDNLQGGCSVRLYPPVSQEEAQTWLTAQAANTLGEEAAATMADDLTTMAEAMSIISAVELPDELEPLFP
jgi:hypothetical protein